MDLFVCELFFRLWMTSHSISEADGFCGTLIWWSIFFLFLMSIPFYQFVSLRHGGHRGSDVWMLMSRRKAVLKGSLDSCSPKLTGSQKCLSEVLVPSVCIEIFVHSLAHSADSCCTPAVLHRVQQEPDRQGGAPPCPVLHRAQVDSHSWSRFAGCWDRERVVREGCLCRGGLENRPNGREVLAMLRT